jgi:hypothetical protein
LNHKPHCAHEVWRSLEPEERGKQALVKEGQVETP